MRWECRIDLGVTFYAIEIVSNSFLSRKRASVRVCMGGRKSIGAYKWYLLRLLFFFLSICTFSINALHAIYELYSSKHNNKYPVLIFILFYSYVIRNIEWLHNIVWNWGGFNLCLFLWIFVAFEGNRSGTLRNGNIKPRINWNQLRLLRKFL